MRVFDEDEIDKMIQKALEEKIEVDHSRTKAYKPLEDAPKAQIMVTRQLIVEMQSLEDTLDSYRRRSYYMTLAMILLSAILAGIGIARLLIEIGVVI